MRELITSEISKMTCNEAKGSRLHGGICAQHCATATKLSLIWRGKRLQACSADNVFQTVTQLYVRTQVNYRKAI